MNNQPEYPEIKEIPKLPDGWYEDGEDYRLLIGGFENARIIPFGTYWKINVPIENRGSQSEAMYVAEQIIKVNKSTP